MKKSIGEELLSQALSKLILVVAFIVCFGAIMGTVGYVMFHGPLNAEEVRVQLPNGFMNDEFAGWKATN